MSKIDIHVYGVHERDGMIAATVEKLGLCYDNVHYDDRTERGLMMYTAKKAWLSPIPNGVTHRVALADDVEVCDGFWEICEQIIDAHPDAIISLFPYEFMSRIPAIEDIETPYFKCNVLSGCAIIMPVEYIQPCFDYVKQRFDDNCADDEGIQAYAEDAGVEMLTTVPATVQHIGDDSVAFPGRLIRRTEYYEVAPKADWANPMVMEYIEKEWFFSNHGKRRTGCGHIQVYKDNDHNLTSTNRK